MKQLILNKFQARNLCEVKMRKENQKAYRKGKDA